MPHPMHPLIIDPDTGDTLYVGDLSAGIRAVERDRVVFVIDTEHGARVTLNDSHDPDDVAEWGEAPTYVEAFRYAIGAALGPIDDEYDESRLIAYLQVV